MVESQSVVVARSKEFLSGKYDIVGSLPFEIVLEIVKYLDPDDIVRNQRVRIAWLSMSRSLISPGWTRPRSLNGGGRFSRPMESWNILCAEHSRSFIWETTIYKTLPMRWFIFDGNMRWNMAGPSRSSFSLGQNPLMPFDSRMVSYHSRRLFYQAGHSDRVEMLDLETGERLLCPQELSEHTTPEFRVSDYYVVVGSNEYEQAIFYFAGRP